MVLVDEIDILDKKEKKRLRKLKLQKMQKDLGLPSTTDKLYLAQRIKIVYRERLKRFKNQIARFRDKRAIKRISKHLREIDIIYYEIDEECIDILNQNLENRFENNQSQVNSLTNQDYYNMSFDPSIESTANLLNRLNDQGIQKKFAEDSQKTSQVLPDTLRESTVIEHKFMDYEESDFSDTQSVLSQVNRLTGTKDSPKRFFGRNTKKVIDSNQVTNVCIYGNIRNLEFSKDDDDFDTIVFISEEGTKFTKRDVYWVRRFQIAWRLRQFKALTMKIVRQNISFREQREAAARRRAFKKVVSTKEIFRPEGKKSKPNSKRDITTSSKKTKNIFASEPPDEDQSSELNFFEKVKGKLFDNPFSKKEKLESVDKPIEVVADAITYKNSFENEFVMEESFYKYKIEDSKQLVSESSETALEISFSNHQR